MTLIFDTESGAATTPITDVRAWLEQRPPVHGDVLRTLGALLTGSAQSRKPRIEDADGFTRRCLGDPDGRLAIEWRDLTFAESIGVAMALDEFITLHDPELGPGEDSDEPSWDHTELGDDELHHPRVLRAAFPAGTLVPHAPVVVGIDLSCAFNSPPNCVVAARPEHHAAAVGVLDRLRARGEELNPFRGRILRCTYGSGLSLSVTDVPATLTRDTVHLPDTVWRELDLAVRSARRAELLNAVGLGCRRGVLLAGPPGTGKSAACSVVARELAGEFTVFIVDSAAGSRALTDVVVEARRLAPALLILDDLDLYCQDRSRGGGGLSEVLAALDVSPDAAMVVLASTNDATTLDKAAVRTGRFDAVIEIDCPTKALAARILATYVSALPGANGVDCAAVAAALPAGTTGSDLREVVRRAVLAAEDGEAVTTAMLLAEVGAGRYKAELPGGGAYL